jgi:hypothetical protein
MHVFFISVMYFVVAADYRLVRLAGCQPASSAFLSHQFSISHQLASSISFTTNQH